MKQIEELETSGWIICKGDMFSNGYAENHLKVTNIELDDAEGFEGPDNAKIYCVMVNANDHDEIVSAEQWHRAWYINDSWYK
ncbi:hypothetical protein [Domibacillus aminovorans]|uniref:Uncharacterized protein n=1 Tax=Domibacillus aminovorans TaxID=29332 RepID=A0A177L9L2_9BACI|nr:hypothetical protein [Domibacillus aminovorans]OAH61982.1 hypothetical protein AWH49_11215 [Domibacillus aminovorans]